jgi:hypothetical protein
MFQLPASIRRVIRPFAPLFTRPTWEHLQVLLTGLERRKGERIAAKGVSRDAVRSSKRKVVTGLGLQWICMALLVPLPWSRRAWA